MSPIMSSTPLPTYLHPAETQKNRKQLAPEKISCIIASKSKQLYIVTYVDLATLDLSEYDKPGGKDKLVQQLKESILTIGSFRAPERCSTYNANCHVLT